MESSWPQVAVLAACWCSPALVVLGMLRHRPLHRGPWTALAVVLALTAAALTVAAAGHQRAAGVALVVAWGAGLVVTVVVASWQGPADRSRRGTTLRLHRWTDPAVVTAGTVLVAVEAMVLRSTPGTAGLQVAATGIGTALAGALLWLCTTRATGSASLVLLAAGVAACLARDVAGPPLASTEGWPLVATLLAAGLPAAAALHPSMHRVGPAPADGGRRRASAALVVLLPFALAPVGVALVNAVQGSPLVPWAPQVIGGLVIVLLVARAASTVRWVEGQAERDETTGLLNRRGLGERLRAVRCDGTPTWAAVIDVDGFKQINDRYGHDVGDAVLRVVGRRLARAAGPTGWASRPGGDEFVVLAPAGGAGGGGSAGSTGATGDADAVDADALAARLEACFAEPVVVPRFARRVTASVGVAPVRLVGEEDAVLADADVAMYAAKQQGRARAVVHAPGMREAVLGRGALLQDLRDLLGDPDGTPAADVGHLVVRYQPVVDVHDGTPIAAEALVRWQHPQRGLLTPDAFVPLAEELGLGAALDLAVLRQAMHQVTAWDATGIRVHRVGVNLGRGSLASPALADDVRAACAAAGLGLDRLVLEIVEHEEAPTDAACAAALRSLVDGGASVALDDFGTGYSGVGYLRRFPVHVIKLDRSLLPAAGPAAAPGSAVADAASLVRGVVALAHAVGVEITAEGIETAEQRDLVHALGVQHGQGWLYAPALEPHEVTAHFARAAAGGPSGAPAEVEQLRQ